MAERKYMVGKYKDYYDSLRGEMTAKGKATTFVSEVQNMVQEFYSISNVMVYWSGQAKNAMTNDAMTRIMDELRITQENLQTNLEPCCEKIDKISNNLTTMQEKEDEYLQLQNDLERVEGELSRLGGTWTYTEGGTRTESEVSSHNAQVEAKEQEKAQLEEKIEAIVAELDALKIELDADIRAIEQFESELQEFTNYVNLTGTVFGVGSSDAFSHYTLEERLNYIQQIMDNYQEIYESLNSVYKERYGKGFSFSIDDFKNLDIIFDSFDIYWMAGLDKNGMRKGTSGNNILFDVDKLTKLISYCSTSGIFDRIEKYLNGASWKESGLEDFYWENSPNALKINVFGEDELKRRLKANYGVDAKDVRSFLKSKYEIFKTSKEHLMVEYGEYQKLSSAMSVIKEKISNLKNAKKLIPYEMQMENPDFQNYLNKDYSGYSYLPADKLELMSQKEIALYDYLLHNKSKQEADNYLAAMKNAFDMRIGAKNAAKYIEWVKEDGFSVDDLGKTGWEGFKDGVRGFGKGIERLFTAWAVEEGDKDAYDYEMMYKSQWLSQLMQDPTFIDQNTVNNTLGWADLNAWYSTSSSIGNMIIPSIIGMIPGGQGLSSALFAVSIAGNSAYEARQQGYSVGQAYLYGAITGASEALTEKMLGGIQGLSTKALGKGIIGNMFNEGLEEFTQEFLDPYVRSKVFGEELDLSAAGMNAMFNRALEAGKYGALTAGVMQAGTSTVSKFVVDPITRRAGVTVTGADGVQRQARTYQEFLQDRTINKTVTKASEVINNSLTKMDNGQTLSLGEKIQLNNALKDVSVQDLSRMKSELSPEKQTQLRQAVEGVAILSSKTNSKLDLADRFAQVSDGKTSLTEVQFEEDDFKEEVTRDGRTLAEYIADTRAGAQTTVTASSSENNTRINGLTTEERAHIDSISHKGLKAIDSQAKHNAKVEKRAARREIIKDYLGLNNGKTDSTRTSTTRTEQGNRDQAGQQDRSGQTEITETRTQTEQGRTEQTQRVESRTQTEQGRTEQTQRVESRTQTEQGRTEQTQRSEAEERIQPAQGAVRSVITEDARVSNSGRTTAEVAKPAQSSQVLDQEVSTNERSKPQVKQNDNSGSNGPVAASSGIVQDSYILGQVLDGQNDADIDSREEISRPHSSETIASQAQEVAKSGASMAAAAAATAGVIGRDVTLSSETATTSSNTSVGQKSNTTTTVGNSENKIGVQENTGFRTEQKKAQDSVIEQNESNVQQTSSETLTQNGDLERKNVLDLIKEQRQQNSNSSSEIVAIDINEISEENDIKEPEKFTPEDWILVRSSPFLPVNGVIQTAYDAGAKGIDPVAKINSERVKSSTFNRHTLHFAINGLVKGGFVGAANWNASPFFVLEPFKYHVNESLVGGFIGDVYFDGNVKLSNEAVILVNRSYYEANRSSLPSEYNYVVFDGDPTIAIEKVMKSMGYLPINQQKRIDNYVGNGDRLQSKMFTDFNNFLESGSYYSGMHDSTIHNTYETSIGTTQALIEYLRGKNIDINSEIKLSESEAFSIVQALANQERMETKMNKSDYDSTAKSLLESTSNESGNAYIFIKYGLKYDVNTGEFSVVSYKEYQQRSKLLYEINQYNNYVNEYNELRNAIDNNLISNPEVLDTSIQKVDFLREKIKFVENNRATIENEISQAKEVIDKHVKAELNAIEESNASRASHIEELNRIKNIRDNKIELSEFLNNNGIDPNVSTELTAREVLDLAHKSGKKTAVFIEKSGLVFNQETGTFTYVGLSDIAGLRQLLSSSDYVSSTNQNYELLIDKIINNRNLIDLTLEQCREGVEFDNIDELISTLDEETAKYVIDECNEMLNYEKTRSKGKKTLNSILEQLSKKYNIVSQLEDTIKGLTPAELSQTLLNERYVDVKEYAEQFLESNSSEKAKMLAAVIPAAIQNGDVELINKIKDKISQKEYSQI
ncbi:MAG: hypothetical protein IKQ33_00940, partial [Clostridia bacterium]|nr:hypothetical protein [Clostridia bacterium]